MTFVPHIQKIKDLKIKPFGILHHYEQGVSKNEVFFAFAGALGWNTGVILTDAEVASLGRKLKTGPIPAKMNDLSANFRDEYDMFTIPPQNWKEAIRTGFGVLFGFFPDEDFWREAVEMQILHPEHGTKDQNHCVWLREFEGRLLLETSYMLLEGYRAWDITESFDNWVERGYFRGFGYIFTSKK